MISFQIYIVVLIDTVMKNIYSILKNLTFCLYKIWKETFLIVFIKDTADCILYNTNGYYLK